MDNYSERHKAVYYNIQGTGTGCEQEESAMRITTQMLNQTSAETGIAINSVSLVNYLDDDTDTTSLLDSLQTSTTQITSYEELEEAATSLESAVQALTDDSEDSLFAMAQESGDNSEVMESIRTLAEKYNELLEELSDSTSTINSYYLQAIKKLTSSNSDELSLLGITIESDGSLTVDESVLESASLEDLENLFGADSEFMESLSSLASKVSDSAAAELESTASQYTSSATATSSYTSSQYDWWG